MTLEELLMNPELVDTPPVEPGRYVVPASHYPGPGPRPAWEQQPEAPQMSLRQLQGLVQQLKGVPPVIQSELIRRMTGLPDATDKQLLQNHLLMQRQAALQAQQNARQDKSIAAQEERQNARQAHSDAQLDKRLAHQSAENEKRFEELANRIAPKALSEAQRKGIEEDLAEMYADGITDEKELAKRAEMLGAIIVGKTTSPGFLGFGGSTKFHVGAAQAPTVQGRGNPAPAPGPTPQSTANPQDLMARAKQMAVERGIDPMSLTPEQARVFLQAAQQQGPAPISQTTPAPTKTQPKVEAPKAAAPRVDPRIEKQMGDAKARKARATQVLARARQLAAADGLNPNTLSVFLQKYIQQAEAELGNK